MNGQVLIAGVGMVPFRRPGQSDPYDVMAEAAVRSALADARLDYDLVDQAFAGFVFADSCAGQRALYRLGISGIPIANVNNNCASGSTALYLARQAVLSGEAECALAVGFEEMQPGALDRVFPQRADPLELHRGCVGEAMGFGERGARDAAGAAALQRPARMDAQRTRRDRRSVRAGGGESPARTHGTIRMRSSAIR